MCRATPWPLIRLTVSPELLGALQRFLEGLLEAYSASVEEHSAARAVLLAAAAAELLQVHALLAEHAVALGYVDKLLKILQAHLPPQEGSHGLTPTVAMWLSKV